MCSPALPSPPLTLRETAWLWLESGLSTKHSVHPLMQDRTCGPDWTTQRLSPVLFNWTQGKRSFVPWGEAMKVSAGVRSPKEKKVALGRPQRQAEVGTGMTILLPGPHGSSSNLILRTSELV